MKRVFLCVFVIFLGGLCMFVEGEVSITNCPGNIFSRTGEAKFTLPSASGDASGKSESLDVTCTSPSESTLYKEYVTTVTCTATDSNKDSKFCSFKIYLPDGFGCNRKDPSPQCTCSPFRPFFDPCTCVEGYSGSDCQVKDGSCDKGFKGAKCDIDYEAPVMSCPSDIFTTAKSIQLPDESQVTASDNDDKNVIVVCDTKLGSTIDFKKDLTTSTHTITCTGRDAFGNRADCSFQVTSDLEPPQISACPGNIHTSNSTLIWSLDIATDNTKPKPTITCDINPGDDLTKYVTDVVCDATDKAGNKAKESCRFKIYLDGGTCSDTNPNCVLDSDDGYKCADDFSGLDCEVNDGSTCNSTGDIEFGCFYNSSINMYTCLEGFKGASCEIDYKPPELSNCPSGEIWSKEPVVTYRPMWTGDNNDKNDPLVTCYPVEGSEFYDYRTDVTCSTADSAGNKYSDCKFPVIRSSSSGCTGDDGFCYNCNSRCRCVFGYYGPKCRDCVACENGGTRPDETNCQCECPTLHDGILCNECYEPNKDFCMNGGTFVLTSCRCECPEDWTGVYCTMKHGEECLQSPNAGCSCDAQNCTCLPEYKGPQCETCKPCMNGGTNQDPVSCNCTCPSNFGGLLCTECESYIMCLNGGTFDETTCSCVCTDGWGELDCDSEILYSIECPSNIYRQYDKGKTTAIVTWADPVVKTGAVVTCEPASNSEFQDGATNVTCNATYSVKTVQCSFVVTVDNRAPLVKCPEDLDPYHDRWTTRSLVFWDSVTGTDEVSGTVVATCVPPSGTVFSGTTTVVCTAFDQAMNMGSCTFSVAVYLRGNIFRFPTTLSCAKCDGRCRYLKDKDEYECYCSSGYKEKDDGTCEDIDECSENDPCDSNAECQNTDGSYYCTCNSGFFGSGKACREYPDTLYPDMPNETPMQTYEKKISLDVAIAVDSMFGCDPEKDSMSKECSALMNVFLQNVREKYMDFSPALLRIEVDQTDLARGSIPHTVVYDYSRLSGPEKATTAEGFYDDTISSSIKSGKIGGLKVIDCTNCATPKDMTNLCDGVSKPECDPGYVKREVRSQNDASCYVTCESLCTTDYCTDGTCVHQLPFEPRCRYPPGTVGPTSKPDVNPTDEPVTETELDLPLIIGCSVGGGAILLLILAWILYFVFAKRKQTYDSEEKRKNQDDNEMVDMEEKYTAHKQLGV